MPPRIDFYLLAEQSEQPVEHFVCRLVEKAYHANHRICVYTDSAKHAELLDETLWTFRPDAFLPHHLCGEGPTPPPPIHITYDNAPCAHQDVLINLTSQIPSFFNTFRRVIEIVPAEDERRAQAREHYKAYRQQGLTPQTIDLAAREREAQS